MGAALMLARRGLGNTFPNPAVGCILVKDGSVVGRGWTQPGGRPHAEAVALAQAGASARGATAYVTLEPCAHQGVTPPCANLLSQAGVARVVAATIDPDPRVSGRGLAILREAGVQVTQGVREDDARQVNLGFILARTQGRPMFTLKLATDAHGRIPGPDATGDAKWITSPEARLRGHLLRAQHDAVLFGIGTVLADDPEYTCRLGGLEGQSPIRILLDSRLRLPEAAKLLSTLDKAPLWVISAHGAPGQERLERQGVTVIAAPGDTIEVPWVAQELANRGLTRVLIEAGPRVAGAFAETGFVDQFYWFRSARTLAGGVPAMHGSSPETLALHRQAVLQAGPDTLEISIRRA